MYFQFERNNSSLASFTYDIKYSDKEKNCDSIFFKKPEHGSTISLCGHIGEEIIELNIYDRFVNKTIDNDITKELCGDFRNNDIKGYIYYCGKKGSNFLNGIYYWTFEFSNEQYNVYEVGLGRKGIYFCVWQNNELTAIVKKNTHTKNFESKYEIYSGVNNRVSFLAVVNMFWDITRYFITNSGEEWHTLNTWQKELKSKFDLGFIEKIKKEDGIE